MFINTILDKMSSNSSYISPTGFKYNRVLIFEENFLDNNYRIGTMNWMRNNWTLSLLISLIYVLIIFGLKRYMENRIEYKLKSVLVLWNAGLAIFSILGALRTLPEFIYTINEKGFRYSVCVETFSYGVTGFWLFLFVLSKPLELLDTIFLLLRKREVIFLQWYHHLTVLLMAWLSTTEYPSTSRWFSTINYSIHAIMYSYFTIMSLKIVHMPKWISMMITGLQILQMIVGIYVNYKAYQFKQKGECSVSYMNIYLTILMYLSFFYLFFKFFFDKYFRSNQKLLLKKKY